jgi:hypothetical protein
LCQQTLGFEEIGVTRHADTEFKEELSAEVSATSLS